MSQRLRTASFLSTCPASHTRFSAGLATAPYTPAKASPSTEPGQCLQLLPSQQAVLESVLQGVAMGWMCILVGGPGVGKTSLARTAAQLAGRKLTEIALTGGTDTADLLGGFEQLEPKRKVQVSKPCCACFEFKQQARHLFLHCMVTSEAVKAVNSPVGKVLFKRCLPLLVRYNNRNSIEMSAYASKTQGDNQVCCNADASSACTGAC